MRVAELKMPSTGAEPGDPGVIWVICPYPPVILGLGQILGAEVQSNDLGDPPPAGRAPSLILVYGEDPESLSENIERTRTIDLASKEHSGQPEQPPILGFGMDMELPLALAALRAGARGFVHASMEPDQILRALSVAITGEIVAPRELLGFLLGKLGVPQDTGTGQEQAHLPKGAGLTSRQIEILGLVGEGLDNNEVARRLFLSESTVKQHLRGAYKVLGAKNRTEAVRLIRDAG